MTDARNAQAEATAVLGSGFVGRVLEPSPPAVDDGALYADDPVNAEVGPGRIVSPVNGDLSWTDYVADHPDLAEWAAHRRLTDDVRLPELPADLERTRLALHRLATYVIAPARHQANGKFGLRWTAGGFGTPFFGDDRQVRVENGLLVVQDGDRARSTEITSLQGAADFIGSTIDTDIAAEHDSPPPGPLDESLHIDRRTADFLAAWWGFGTAALERLRADDASVDPGRVQLWPGHFDPATEVGDEDRRASYGASPGDAGHSEPYLYVSVWWPDRLDLPDDDPYWNAEGYRGALLPYSKIVEADDHLEAAVEFYRAGRDRLVAG